MKNYLERDWACKEEIRPMPTELSVWSFISYDGSSKATLDLGVFSTVKDQTVHMTVYCPFWMINNTGLLLAYKVRWQESNVNTGRMMISSLNVLVQSLVKF